MNPVIGGALITGGLGALGSMWSARKSQDSANQMMAFQDLQSRTQWQRAVADMKAAGINPMLATQRGPNVAMSGAQASIPDMGASITRGISSGASAAQSAVTVNKINQEIANLGLDEVAKGLDNESKGLLVKFEKSLSDEAYKLYKMPILKFLGEALGAPGVVAEIADSEVVGAGKYLGEKIINPVETMDGIFKYAAKKGKEFAQEYGQDGFRSLQRAIEDIYADIMTRREY